MKTYTFLFFVLVLVLPAGAQEEVPALDSAALDSLTAVTDSLAAATQSLEQQQQLVQEEVQLRNILIGGVVLVLVLLGITLRAYIVRRRATQRLVNQNLAMLDQQQELERMHANTEALGRIGQKVNHHLNVESVAEALYKEINRLMPAEVFGIGLYNPEKLGITFKGAFEKGEKLPEFTYLLSEERVATKCFTEEVEILINDWQAEYFQYVPEKYDAAEGNMPDSLIYLPLTTERSCLGVISIQSFRKKAYSENDINLLRSIGAFVTKTLENATLYENMEEKVLERAAEIIQQKEEIEQSYNNIHLLSEIGQQITSTLDFENIFDKLHTNVNQLMDAEIFGVRVYHPDAQQIEYKYEIESGKRDPVEFITMEDEDNYTVWCIKNKKEIHIGDNRNEFTKYVNEIKVPSGEMPDSLLFCPMLLEERIVGAITVQCFQKNAYTPYHMDILRTLANYTAIALDNAALYQNMEQKVQERTEEVVKQAKVIDQRNKNLSDSLNYARRLQNSLLPPNKFIDDLLPDNFICYYPKDIVSGDFYWVERKDGKVFFAVGDCTGHGVPGAFMSIVSLNILNQAVNEKQIIAPNSILDFVDVSISLALGNRDGDKDVLEGMDIALCAYDPAEMTIEFSGAFNPLYIFRDNELLEFRGDNTSIGYAFHNVGKSFSCETIPVQKGDMLYLFSDGYADQFGGPTGRKFGTKRFKQVLQEHHRKQCRTQYHILEDRYFIWKAGETQLDDVCVMGVRL